MSLFEAILLGLLQGLTEFLPVSSSGHLVLAQSLLPGFEQPGVLFDVLLHLGTFGAVIVYFRRDLIRLAMAPFCPDAHRDRRLLWQICLASIPTAIIGLLFKDFFIALFDLPRLVAGMLLVTGLWLYLAERPQSPLPSRTELKGWEAFLAGVAQGAAIVPGISRSGSTIGALLLLGIDGASAARFSFLMALPAVFGATLLELLGNDASPAGLPPVYLAGAATAFLVGLLAIHALLKLLRQRRLRLFAWYCWCVGGIYLLATSL